ncbi:MAG: RNA polymerase sigma factor [Phycisphaerae bacterium]|nr:RNA polymerase sigma factor [Phycisphaerae bacterium]
MIACSDQMFYTDKQMIEHLFEHLVIGALPGSNTAAVKPQTDGVQFASAVSNKTSNILFSELDDICRSQKGDSEAYRRLIERYQSHISRLLWRFTRDKTFHEELVQETFVQAYLSLHTYKSQAPFEHWLTRIATRTGYRFWKQSNRHQHLSLDDGQWEQTAAAEPDTLTPEQAADIVHRLLSQLPPRDRLVLTLRYLEQCDVEETARRTGWSQTLVKVQTHRAKQKLKALLEKSHIQFEMD